jgi:haloalkane dehalogenase
MKTVESVHTSLDTRWLDTQEYPFRSQYILIEGRAIHYVDEGEGDVALMVHGTPVWSFLYRKSIKELVASGRRCVALDHLGFGLSDKPVEADYSPRAHARRLAAFVKALRLQNVTIVAQDYGGPIALDYASSHPDNVRGLALSNTWAWSLPHMEFSGKLLDNVVGKWLYLNYGFSPKVLIPQSFANKKKLAPDIHRHYLAALDSPARRVATFALVQALKNNKEWYNEIQSRLEALRDKPVQMIWGMSDRFVQAEKVLPLWKELWRNAEYTEIANAGHFVEEEAPEEFSRALLRFFERLSDV